MGVYVVFVIWWHLFNNAVEVYAQTLADVDQTVYHHHHVSLTSAHTERELQLKTVPENPSCFAAADGCNHSDVVFPSGLQANSIIGRH